MPEPFRGDVWMADLDPVRGHEQAGRRPALVISTDRFNQSRIELVFIVPISSKLHPLATHVSVSPPEGGLTLESEILCEHLRCVSHERLIRRMGSVSDEKLDAVSERLRYLMEL
jgi:mRNA interferase MazF